MIKKIIKKFYKTPHEKMVKKFKMDNGNLLRLEYAIDKNSLVIDAGGYKGQWASDIYAMYNCTIHIFEPLNRFADNIETRFKKNDKIFVHKIGLSSANKKEKIYLDNDGTSVFKKHGECQEIQLVKSSEFFKKNNIDQIDLMKINIEGGEYDLLDDLIKANIIKNIKNIQIQFHDFVPAAEEKMKKIQNELKKTHRATYQYKFVWENWAIKIN